MGLGLRPRALPGHIFLFVDEPGGPRATSPTPPPFAVARMAEMLSRKILGQSTAFVCAEIAAGDRPGLPNGSTVAYAVRAQPQSCAHFLVGLTHLDRLPNARSLYAAARDIHRIGDRRRRRAATPVGWREQRQDRTAAAATRRIRELSSVLARVAHDIRLPISALRATTAALRTALQPSHPNMENSSVIERVTRLERQIRSLENFCNDVLSVQTGQRVPAAGKAKAFGVLIADALDAYHDALALRSIRVHREGGSQLRVDPRAEAITHNLLHNATRHAHRNIWSKIGTTGDVAYLDLEDDGPGLPAESVVRGLSRHNIGRGGTGWGIGFESAVQSAETAGGTLRALPPQRGSGARFLLVLPRVDAHFRSTDDGRDLAEE